MIYVYVILTVLFIVLSIVIAGSLVVVSVLRSYLLVKDHTPETLKELSFEGVPKQLEHLMFHGASNGASSETSNED